MTERITERSTKIRKIPQRPNPKITPQTIKGNFPPSHPVDKN